MQYTPPLKDKLKACYNLQGGKCCYCNEESILSPSAIDILGRQMPPIMATLEHLHPVSDKSMPEKDVHDMPNLKMACQHCNKLLGNLPRDVKERFFKKIARPKWMNDFLNKAIQAENFTNKQTLT